MRGNRGVTGAMAMDSTVNPESGRVMPLSKTAKLMARHMSAAWQAPMFALACEVDMSAAMTGRAPGVTVTDVILSACVRSLSDHPKLNAHYRDDATVEFDDVNIGLAVAAEKGLTVPVIHAAQSLSLAEIAARRRDLVEKTRAGRVRITDVTGGTFTVSNLGMFDITRFTAIVNPPQVAILAVGSVNRRQVWNGGEPQWRPIAELTLTCDHRAIDGAAGAAFLGALKRRLEGKESAA